MFVRLTFSSEGFHKGLAMINILIGNLTDK